MLHKTSTLILGSHTIKRLADHLHVNYLGSHSLIKCLSKTKRKYYALGCTYDLDETHVSVTPHAALWLLTNHIHCFSLNLYHDKHWNYVAKYANRILERRYRL